MPSKIAGLGRRGRHGTGPSQKVQSILPMRVRFLDRVGLCPASGMTRGRHDATPLSLPASTSGTHEHFDPPVLLPACRVGLRDAPPWSVPAPPSGTHAPFDPPVLLPACLVGLGAFRPRLAEGTRANPRRRDARAPPRGLPRGPPPPPGLSPRRRAVG